MRLPNCRPLFRGVSLALAFVVMGAVLSVGQYDVPQAVDIASWKPAEFSGKLNTAKGTTLTALNFGNETIFIHIVPQFIKTLSVKGTAEPSAIKTGMGIRFSGKLDEKGVIADKISDLYIVSHEGALPECAINEDTEIAGTIVSNDAKGNVKATVNAVKKEAKGDKEVIVKRVKLVSFQVADDAKITVDVKDVSLARPNDSIVVTGKQVRNADNVDSPNNIIAETLTIDMAEPLSNKKRVATKEPKGKTDAFKEGAKQAGEGGAAPAAGGDKMEPPAKNGAPKKEFTPKKAPPKLEKKPPIG